MCGHCGCGNQAKATLRAVENGKEATTHHHEHETRHSHSHEHAHDCEHGHHHHCHDHEHVHADGTRHTHARDHGQEHAIEHEHFHEEGVPHHHFDDHDHGHDDDDRNRSHGGTVATLEARILAKNDALAATNRAWFAGREILALNIVSSPGAGKTTLLEQTIRDLKSEMPLFVLEGDQATMNDGVRIRTAGAPAVQINTGTGCHLEADMVARGLMKLKPSVGSVVMIENVGNLVCPAMFDLGEHAKVIVFAVTEGEDKPLKYPHMFQAADVMILNKIDLLPHLDFDVDTAISNAREVNPDIAIIRCSARNREGLDVWYDWLREQRTLARTTMLV
jgi:hydrogenase nickel incorporation protein HypB